MASEDTHQQNTWGYVCPFLYTTTTTPFYNITTNPNHSLSLYPDDTASSISSDIEILSHGDFSGGSSGEIGSSENGGGPDSSATKHVEHVGIEREGVDPEAVGHVYFEHVQGQPAAQWLTHG